MITWNDKKGRTAHLQGDLVRVILHLVSWYSSIKKTFWNSVILFLFTQACGWVWGLVSFYEAEDGFLRICQRNDQVRC